MLSNRPLVSGDICRQHVSMQQAITIQHGFNNIWVCLRLCLPWLGSNFRMRWHLQTEILAHIHIFRISRSRSNIKVIGQCQGHSSVLNTRARVVSFRPKDNLILYSHHWVRPELSMDQLRWHIRPMTQYTGLVLDMSFSCVFRSSRSRSAADYSGQTFRWTICRSVRRSVCRCVRLSSALRKNRLAS